MSDDRRNDSPGSRRWFLAVAGLGTTAWSLGCGPNPAQPSATPTPQCGHPTSDNIEGPFYRTGAPMRADLAGPGTPGTRLTVRGRVMGTDCTPIEGVVLDLWQADDGGHYDNDGHASHPQAPPGEYVLRGWTGTDANGAYEFHSIVPGRYLNGGQYRPAHIHVKVSAPGFMALTTQLYFAGDPFNEVDPFIESELIMPIAIEPNGSWSGAFDFVLVPV